MKVYFLRFSAYIILIKALLVSPRIPFFRILKGGAGEKFTFLLFFTFYDRKSKNWKSSFKYAAIFYFFLLFLLFKKVFDLNQHSVGVAFFFVDPEASNPDFFNLFEMFE